MEVEFSLENARSQATFTFTKENFSKIKGAVLSPPCMIRNLPWKIMIKPISNNRAGRRQKTLGFYLQCNGNSKSSSWSSNARGSLTIVSQMEGVEDFTESLEHLFSLKENDCGYREFMMWNDVLDPDKGYIKNDTVIFQVKVNADAPRGVGCDSTKCADSSSSQSNAQKISASSRLKKRKSRAKRPKITVVSENCDSSTDRSPTEYAALASGQQAKANADALPVVCSDFKICLNRVLCQSNAHGKSTNSSSNMTNSEVERRETSAIMKIPDGSIDGSRTKNAVAANVQQTKANAGALPVGCPDFKICLNRVLCQSNAHGKLANSSSNLTNSEVKRQERKVVTEIRDGSTDGSHTKNAVAANVQQAKVNVDAPNRVSCDSKRHADNSIIQVTGNMNNSSSAEVRKTTTSMKTNFTDENSRSEATFTFIQENFSKIEGTVLSPPCMIRNLPWKIMIQPQLINRAYGLQKTLGFYLLCHNDSKSSSWSCNVNGSLTIVSQKESAESFTVGVQHSFSSERNGWGFPSFIAWDYVIDPNKGFIKNDTVIFRAKVNAGALHEVSHDPRKDADSQLCPSKVRENYSSFLQKKTMPLSKNSRKDVKRAANFQIYYVPLSEVEELIIQCDGEFENYALKLPLQSLPLPQMNPRDTFSWGRNNYYMPMRAPDFDACVTICPQIQTDQFIVIQILTINFYWNKFSLFIEHVNYKYFPSLRVPKIHLYSPLQCKINDIFVVWLNEHGEIRVSKIDQNARMEPSTCLFRGISSGQYELLGNVWSDAEQIRCFIGDRKAAQPFLWKQSTSVSSTLPSDTIKTASPLFLTCELRGDQMIPIEIDFATEKSEEINKRVRWDDEKLCKICIDNAANVVIVPCGHLCLCNECGLKMKSRKNSNCPICRSNIENTQIVYFS